MAADKTMGTQAFQNEAEFRSKGILDPQAALLFKGVEFREFQFDFQLLARTKEESENIRKIIKTFKWAMHPAKGGGVTWQYPCFFEIYLLTPTRKYMFNIMNSALIRMDVDYGGSGIPAFFTKTGVGTIVAEGKDVREFDGQKYIMERSLVSDISLVKAWKADRAGNLVYRLTAQNFNPVVAMAGKITVAEVEEIVENGELIPDQIHTPSIYVHRIVLNPNPEKRIEQRTITHAA